MTMTVATASRWPHRSHLVAEGNPGRGRTFTRCGAHLVPRHQAEVPAGTQVSCRHCARILETGR